MSCVTMEIKLLKEHAWHQMQERVSLRMSPTFPQVSTHCIQHTMRYAL